MEDLKALIFPIIAALILHGFLFSVKLPKQKVVKALLKAAPIEIEINSFSPPPNIPKKVETGKEKIAPEPKTKEALKHIAKQPVVVPDQLEKKQIIPEPKKLRPVVKKIDPPEHPIEKQVNKEKKSPTEEIEEIIEKAFVEEVTAETLPTIENKTDQDETLSKEVVTTPPVQRKAVPMYRQNSQPVYPAMAKRRGHEGELLLSVLVDTAGKVSELKVKYSSGYASLDRAALKAVKNWSFIPATEGDRPVVMWVDVPIMFQLK